jgi:hypothetical protein
MEIFGKTGDWSAHILHRGWRWLRQGRQLNAFNLKYSLILAAPHAVEKSEEKEEGDENTNANNGTSKHNS